MPEPGSLPAGPAAPAVESMADLDLGSPAGAAMRRKWRPNPPLSLGLLMLLLILLLSVSAPLLTSFSPIDMADSSLSPPSHAHLLGTDQLGRDTFARVLFAARTSLLISGLTALIASLAGTAIGVASGYWSGVVDVLLMRFLDILQAFPALLLAIASVAIFGPSIPNLIFTMGTLFMPRFARVARASTLSVRERDYIAAATVLGVSSSRIVCRHILPNIATPLIVELSLTLTLALLTEASLSFLGLGVQPPEPTWGGMIADSMSVMSLAPWLALGPGIAIMVAVLALLLIGDGLRDILDPRM